MNDLNRITVNGIKIFPFTSVDELLSYISDKHKILVAINSKKIKGANNELIQLVNSNIGYVDGAGALIALKHKGCDKVIKIPGCELWLHIVAKYFREKTFYLVGGKQEVIDSTISKLKTEYPGINIVGYRNGYFSSSNELDTLKKDIQDKKPDIVFIAMGSPTQEHLMLDLLKLHPALYQGLGGSFDVYVGRVRRAPKWFADNNLEGIYRAFFEPKKRLKGVLSDIKFLFSLYTGKY